MPDAPIPSGGAPAPAKGQGLSVPADVAKTFGPLVALIGESESMNDEERQYWINILPVMTPDQVRNLQDILENERKQLRAIDEKYAKELENVQDTEFLRTAEQERQKKRETRTAAESTHKREEEQKTEDLLRQIESGT
ncbi:MAG: hypothetical protein PHW10_00610 [Candidatus Peribacteraceae bacterium]|nr:hypothetical protein [Candidatus Peribacteraceae bacterium]